MRISDWSSDVCSSDLFAQSVGLGEAAKGAMLGRGEPHRLGAGAHRAAPGEMLFAIAGNGGIMPFLRSCVWRDAISIPSNPQKSWMHPCVRCVSELRSEEHTSELQSLMRISYAVFCLKKKKTRNQISPQTTITYI